MKKLDIIKTQQDRINSTISKLILERSVIEIEIQKHELMLLDLSMMEEENDYV